MDQETQRKNESQIKMGRQVTDGLKMGCKEYNYG
jgi:hypothetical protein